MRSNQRLALTNAALLGASALALWIGIAKGIPSLPSPARNQVFPDPESSRPVARLGGKPIKQTIVLAGGCFWGVEAVFEHLKGVTSVLSGYAGGRVGNPSYETVSSGQSGHAEAVKITFDPSKISIGQILKVFFSVAHDPTQVDRQGPDVGSQYRSAIFVTDSEQGKIARSYIQQLTEVGIFKDPIATNISLIDQFFPAEEYHQDFIKKHPTYPYVVLHDLPKLRALSQSYPELYQP